MKPVLVSTWGPTPKKHLGAFLHTAKLHGLDPQNFDPTDWEGADWTTIPWYKKSEGQARFVREHANEFTHFLFTDSYDIVFAAGWGEILAKYAAFNSPIVCAAECYPWPKTEQASLYPQTIHRCKYLNAGGWIGETQAALAMLEDVAATAAKREQCDQGILVDLFLSKKHPIELDRKCSIFYCMNMGSDQNLSYNQCRAQACDTSEYPIIFHGNGASPLERIAHHIAP